jgi:hypothetical protein
MLKGRNYDRRWTVDGNDSMTDWRKPYNMLWHHAGLDDVAVVLVHQNAIRTALKGLRRRASSQKRKPQGRLWRRSELRGMFWDPDLQTALYKLLDRFKTNPAYQHRRAAPILIDVEESLREMLSSGS